MRTRTRLLVHFLPLICSVLIVLFARKMSTKPSMTNKNVYKKPLAFFSDSPTTGFYRDGYCRVGPEDGGNHAIAGVLTDEFLDFSASKGNNLRSIGLKDGCKWCLCVSRWKEAFDARKGDSDPIVPKVFLHATSEKALDSVDLKDLKKFDAGPELSTGTERRGVQKPTTPVDPGVGPSKGSGGDN